MNNPTSKRVISLKLIGLSLLIFVSVFYTFSPAGEFEFINLDDDIYITGNVNVNSGLSVKNMKWALSSTHAGHWHPLTWISHMLDVDLFGLQPKGHHLVNVTIHSINSVLLFGLLAYSTNSLFTPLLISLLWGIYPLRVESVAWVSERKDVLHVLLGLLTLLGYAAYVKYKSKLLYFTSIIIFFAGLMSKPMLVTLPVLMLLYDYWPLGRRFSQEFKIIILEKLPFILLAALACVAVLIGQSEAGALRSLSSVSLLDRIMLSVSHYYIYILKLINPTNLAVFYPAQDFTVYFILLAFFTVFTISVFAIFNRKQMPFLFFGWFWFLVSTLPISGLVTVGGQSVADRWTYLPHIGLFVAIAFTFKYFFSPESRLLKTVILSLLTVLLTLTFIETRFYLKFWQDSQSLFARTTVVTNNNFVAYNNLGKALEDKGDIEAAAKNYGHAVRINPLYPVAINNLGSAKAKLGQLEEAEALFHRAIKVHPGYQPPMINLGMLRLKQKRHTDALYYFALYYRSSQRLEILNNYIQPLLIMEHDKLCSDMEIIPVSIVKTKRGFYSRLSSMDWKHHEPTVHPMIEKITGCLDRLILHASQG